MVNDTFFYLYLLSNHNYLFIYSFSGFDGIQNDQKHKFKEGRNWGHYMLEQKLLDKEDNYIFYSRIKINNHNMQASGASINTETFCDEDSSPMHAGCPDYRFREMAILLNMYLPMPGRLGTYFINFYQEYYGDKKARYKDWNLPILTPYVEEFYEKEMHMWNYFTQVLARMTENEDLNISTLDLSAILYPVPDYNSIRR